MAVVIVSSCNDDDDPPPTFTVGGTVSGMTESGSVVLTNGTDEITVTENGSFTFPTAVTNGGTYDVQVQTPPTGQTASVENGKGTVSGANVTNVTVTATNIPIESYLVGGTVSGLNGTLVLVNGEDELTITSDGPYVFPTPLADGTTYDVKIKSDPESQQSIVENGTGTIDGADVTNANVTSTDLPPDNYKIGGEVSGLTSGMLLLANGEDEIEISSDGPFQFPTLVTDGGTYNVTVKERPVDLVCEVTNGEGTVDGANVTDVLVSCTPVDPVFTYTVGGTISGLTGTVVIANNGVDQLTISENGPFTFATPLADGSAYEVTIVTQPEGELCSVSNGSGMIDGANVTNVEIATQEIPDLGTNYFAVNSSTNAEFYKFLPNLSINEQSGAGLTDFNSVTGLAYDTDNDILYGFAGLDRELISINRTTGEGTLIATLETGEIFDLAYDITNDKLYGINYSFGQFLEIDVTSGDITVVYTNPGLKNVFGLAYDPNSNKLYGSRNEDLVEISLTSAAPVLIGGFSFDGSGRTIRGLGYDNENNVLYGASDDPGDTDEFAMDLFTINISDASLTLAGQTGLVNTYGGGMTYVDDDDKLLATWAEPSGSKLYDVNRSDGTTISIGSLGYDQYADLAWRSADMNVYGLEVQWKFLVTFNVENGVTTFKRQVDFGDANINAGLTHKNAGGADIFYTVVAQGTTDTYLASFDGGSDAPAVISSTALGNNVVALAYDNENSILYGATNTGIVIIDETTGEITEEIDPTTSTPYRIIGMNYDPDKDLLVATTDNGDVFAIKPSTGERVNLTNTSPTDLNGIVYKEG